MEYVEEKKHMCFAEECNERMLLRKGFQGLLSHVNLIKALSTGLDMMEHR